MNLNVNLVIFSAPKKYISRDIRMLTIPNFCDKELTDDLLETYEIQNALYNITEESISSIISLLSRCHSPNTINHLPLLFSQALLYRRHNAKLFSSLLLQIYENPSIRWIFFNIKTFIFSKKSFIEPILFPYEISRIHILRLCYDLGLIELKEVIQFCQTLKSFKREYRFQAIFIYFWFLQEIYENDTQFAQSMFYFTLHKTKKHLLKHVFELILNNLREIKENKWKKFHDLLNFGYFEESLAGFILKDNCDSLQALLSSSNINFNEILFPSFFYPFTVQYNQFNLSVFSAFCGSVKCFKFLYLNNMNNIPLNKYFELNEIEAAVCGGNAEILHLCQQNHQNSKALGLAAEFHYNEIFDWIHESTNEEISSKVLDMAVKSNNIYVLVNYFDLIPVWDFETVRQSLMLDSSAVFRFMVSSKKFNVFHTVNSFGWNIFQFMNIYKSEEEKIFVSKLAEKVANDSIDKINEITKS
ncbi:hypothetical protein TRFO_15746 [Tritrichomonas foetus]|uniref:DUF3447 domain-containing protein n=1 Tax=Tritrichomonas foetus TaxID=1144522 RepID=A0A1J4KW95_9EUKA|nr:hypothetical protein TRFO_15746 [Tritrichomonas foetus]|eukprot:OHT13974.1 hypothetical protein TRFO_15746 [Tritrichomonas foetus]